jgi:hypothetical protein
MRRRDFFAGLGLALAAAAAATLPLGEANAQRPPRPGSWELLGSQKVGFIKDRDVVRVGRQDGRFRAIKLRVRDNDVEFLDVKVIYANGEPDDLPVRQHIRKGGETRAIDLKGSTRFIREIQLVYKSRPSFKGFATVEVYGQH